MKQTIGVLATLALVTFLLVPSAVSGQQQPMGFFITSVGPGDGANPGGREGAEQQRQTGAAAVNDLQGGCVGWGEGRGACESGLGD